MVRWWWLPALLLACSRSNPWFMADGDDEPGSSSDGETSADPPVTSAPGEPGSSGGGPGATADDETSGGPVDETGDAASTSETTAAPTGDATGDETGDATSDATTGDATTGDATTGDGCADACGTPGCGDCPGGEMKQFDGFSIDSLETSNAQYQQFLAAKVDPATQPPECAWNSSFAPEGEPGAPERPVVGVDWCDAHAYCAWAGKRLCGAIEGGASSPGAAFDPNKDQWYRACSDKKGLIYPYGPLYNPLACNGLDLQLGETIVGGTLDLCQGPVLGLYDLSGNVWEWVDNCDGQTGAGDMCMRRGGSFKSIPKDLRCDLMSTRTRATALDHVGLRCCSG